MLAHLFNQTPYHQKFVPLRALVQKNNLYHDAEGKFTSKDKAAPPKVGPAQELLNRHAPHRSAEQILEEAIPDAEERMQFQMAEDEAIRLHRSKLSTKKDHTKPGTKQYTKERLELHRAIIKQLVGDETGKKPPRPAQPTLTMVGGRSGSGKGSINVSDPRTSVQLDPDDIKGMLPGYDPKLATAYHEESTDIFDKAIAYARERGLNVTLDFTMSTEKRPLVESFRKRGFLVESYFLHRPPELAVKGAIERYRQPSRVRQLDGTIKEFPHGRIVPLHIVLDQKRNEHYFDKLIEVSDAWGLYDNSEARHKPKLVVSSHDMHYVKKSNPYHDLFGRFTSKLQKAVGKKLKKLSGIEKWKSGQAQEGRVLNGIPLKVEEYPDFSQGVNRSIAEPALHVPKGKHVSAGVVVTEPDGRVWVVQPKNMYGGYKNTFPKGTVEPGEDLQETALREVWEESGLVVKITGHLTDVERTTSVARFYSGQRVGGAPWSTDKHTHAVKLVPIKSKHTDKALENVANLPTSDAKVLAALRGEKRASDCTDYAWVMKFNPFHDTKGLFASKQRAAPDAGGGGGAVPGASVQKTVAAISALGDRATAVDKKVADAEAASSAEWKRLVEKHGSVTDAIRTGPEFKTYTKLAKAVKTAEKEQKAENERLRQEAHVLLAVENPTPVTANVGMSALGSQKGIDEALAFLSKINATGVDPNPIIRADQSQGHHAAYQQRGDMHVQRKGVSASSIVHEMGHAFEDRAGISHDAIAFMDALNEKHGDVAKRVQFEMAYPSHKNPYGKPEHEDVKTLGVRSHYSLVRYGTPDPVVGGTDTELFSTGLGELFSNPVRFARDAPAHFEWTVRMLRTPKTKVVRKFDYARVLKENPYRDKEGKYTDKAHAVAPGWYKSFGGHHVEVGQGGVIAGGTHAGKPAVGKHFAVGPFKTHEEAKAFVMTDESATAKFHGGPISPYKSILDIPPESPALEAFVADTPSTSGPYKSTGQTIAEDLATQGKSKQNIVETLLAQGIPLTGAGFLADDALAKVAPPVLGKSVAELFGPSAQLKKYATPEEAETIQQMVKAGASLSLIKTTYPHVKDADLEGLHSGMLSPTSTKPGAADAPVNKQVAANMAIANPNEYEGKEELAGVQNSVVVQMKPLVGHAKVMGQEVKVNPTTGMVEVTYYHQFYDKTKAMEAFTKLADIHNAAMKVTDLQLTSTLKGSRIYVKSVHLPKADSHPPVVSEQAKQPPVKVQPAGTKQPGGVLSAGDAELYDLMVAQQVQNMGVSMAEAKAKAAEFYGGVPKVLTAAQQTAKGKAQMAQLAKYTKQYEEQYVDRVVKSLELKHIGQNSKAKSMLAPLTTIEKALVNYGITPEAMKALQEKGQAQIEKMAEENFEKALAAQIHSLKMKLENPGKEYDYSGPTYMAGVAATKAKELAPGLLKKMGGSNAVNARANITIALEKVAAMKELSDASGDVALEKIAIAKAVKLGLKDEANAILYGHAASDAEIREALKKPIKTFSTLAEAEEQMTDVAVAFYSVEDEYIAWDAPAEKQQEHKTKVFVAKVKYDLARTAYMQSGGTVAGLSKLVHPYKTKAQQIKYAKQNALALAKSKSQEDLKNASYEVHKATYEHGLNSEEYQDAVKNLDVAVTEAKLAGIGQYDTKMYSDVGKSKWEGKIKEFKDEATLKVKNAFYAHEYAVAHAAPADKLAELKQQMDHVLAAESKFFPGAELEEMKETQRLLIKTQKQTMERLANLNVNLKTRLAAYDARAPEFQYPDNGTSKFKKVMDHQIAIRDKLKAAVKSYLTSYAGNAFRAINKAAGKFGSDGKVPDPYEREKMELVDEAMSKLTLGTDVSLNRTMAQVYVARALGVGDRLHTLSDGQLQNLVGQVYTEGAYSSTSRNPNWGSTFSQAADTYGRLDLKIRAAADVHGVVFHDLTGNNGEKEILLARGTTYVIRAVRRNGSRVEMDVDVVGQLPKPLPGAQIAAPSMG